MISDLIDRIYEAAFIPEEWPNVLHGLSALSGSASSAVLIYPEAQPPRWQSTELVRGSIHDFCVSGDWARCQRATYFTGNLPAGFVCASDHFTPDQLDQDPVAQRLRGLDLDSQIAAMAPLPSGDLAVITFERLVQAGRHDYAGIELLDSLRPHLMRAMVLAARLGLEPARTAVATLQAIGFPAVVLTASGRVLAVNGLVDTLSSTLLPAAHGYLKISHAPAHTLFETALAEVRNSVAVRSIPVPAGEDRQTLILHLLPLYGAAHDIFSGAAVLLVAAPVSMSTQGPDGAILHGLFDLSPAESRLARALASGRSLKEAAVDQRIRFTTARSYLEVIFRKTGTHQQSQLVALLKSAPLLPGMNEHPRLIS